MRLANFMFVAWFVVGHLCIGMGIGLAVVAFWKALCLAGAV